MSTEGRAASEALERQAKNGVDKAEKAADAAIDAAGGKLKSETRQFAEKTDAAAKAAKDAVGRAAEQARGVVADAADRASGPYDDLRARAQAVSERVDPMVRESPYVAVAIAGLAGMLLGALLFGGGGGSRVIYLKPND